MDRLALRVSGRFRALISVPGITGYGNWLPLTWNNHGTKQYGVELRPEQAPWHDLFRALDDLATGLSDAPVSPLDEADAIVAACWRYGTYVHVLAAGEFYPLFRQKPSLSRIRDDEMHRINLEFSSAMADWIATRATDPARINRRVRVVLQMLPLAWRTLGTLSRRREHLHVYTGIIQRSLETLALKLRASAPEEIAGVDALLPELITPRHEANYIVLWAYRNGPIEGLHAGDWSYGSEIPGFVRLYSAEISRVAREAATRVGAFLVAREQRHPMLQYIVGIGGPGNWSLVEETTTIRYHGMPNVGPLDERLRGLAVRYPSVYGGVRLETT